MITLQIAPEMLAAAEECRDHEGDYVRAFVLNLARAIVSQSADHEARLPAQPKPADQPPKLARLEARTNKHPSNDEYVQSLCEAARLDFADLLAAARQADQARIVELEDEVAGRKIQANAVNNARQAAVNRCKELERERDEAEAQLAEAKAGARVGSIK